MEVINSLKDKKVIMTLGPDYLCNTSTIYFIENVMKDALSLRIILDYSFNKINLAKSAYEIEDIITNIYSNIEFIRIKKNYTNFFLSEIDRYHQIKNIFLTEDFDVLMLHDFCYKECVPYGIYSRDRDLNIICYQQGLVAADIVLHHRLYRGYSNKPINKIKYFVLNIALPFFLTGSKFKPAWNTYLNRLEENADIPDCYISFTDFELANLKTQKMAKSYKYVDFSMKYNGSEINEKLYGHKIEKNNLLILPTVGIFDHVIRTLDKSIQEIINDYAIALKKICKNEKVIKVIIKLHPAEKCRDDWLKILEKLDLEYIEIIDQSAENLILENRVIISEFSTVIWWASYYETKKVYSLDLYKLPLFDHYKALNNVTYISCR